MAIIITITTTTNISLYLSCFDFDKFVGMRSERELEVRVGSN